MGTDSDSSLKEEYRALERRINRIYEAIDKSSSEVFMWDLAYDMRADIQSDKLSRDRYKEIEVVIDKIESVLTETYRTSCETMLSILTDELESFVALREKVMSSYAESVKELVTKFYSNDEVRGYSIIKLYNTDKDNYSFYEFKEQLEELEEALEDIVDSSSALKQSAPAECISEIMQSKLKEIDVQTSDLRKKLDIPIGALRL